ncbi:hypothetical protein GIB67_040205 [Kingdonia uniflora]|uniref:SWIM-type domain-containing protein n=1 Tax=Kingdonia uniflora TaxID=39325 RepID=A0A7J7MUT0_9MAGN|nr:hypothetical protein GIB67_040205 [Kingdonia uniflora]
MKEETRQQPEIRMESYLELYHTEELKKHYGGYNYEGEDKDNFVAIWPTRIRWKFNAASHTCECNEWRLSGLPCILAASVIVPMRLPWEGLCSKFHHVSSYVRTYKEVIHDVFDSSNWGKSHRQCEPPPLVRGPGPPVPPKTANSQPSTRVDTPHTQARFRSEMGFDTPANTVISTWVPRGNKPRPQEQHVPGNTHTLQVTSETTVQEGRGRGAQTRG